jgi:hypothetical protein
MNNKQFVAREKMKARESMEAEMTGPGMNTDYSHPRGSGGAGGSPCKYRKREGGLEDKRVITGMKCKCDEKDED